MPPTAIPQADPSGAALSDATAPHVDPADAGPPVAALHEAAPADGAVRAARPGPRVAIKSTRAMPIPDWPVNERPREKLLGAGAAALSDAELLAVFLRAGLPGKSAVELGRELLAAFGSLSRLLTATPQALASVRGIGKAKAAQLLAAVELTRRALAERLARPQGFESPQMVRDYLRLTLAHLPHEVFLCLFLDARNRLLSADQMFRGSLTQTSVFPREVARQALARNAAAVILAHNHPSGHAVPSQADIDMTRALRRTLALIDVQVLDHFVVGGHTAYSMLEHGQL